MTSASFETCSLDNKLCSRRSFLPACPTWPFAPSIASEFAASVGAVWLCGMCLGNTSRHSTVFGADHNEDST
jgi:hypothetical protein